MSGTHAEETQYEDSTLPQLELRNHLIDKDVSERYETYRQELWKFLYIKVMESERD